MTSTGVMGTERYTAPEVLSGRPPSRSSDLFSCGVLLRECAGGAPALHVLVDALTQTDPDHRPDDAGAALELLTAPSPDAATVVLPAPAVAAPPTEVLPPTKVLPPAATATQALPRPAEPRSSLVRAAAAIGGISVVITLGFLLANRGGAAEPLELPTSTGTIAEQFAELDAAVDAARR